MNHNYQEQNIPQPPRSIPMPPVKKPKQIYIIQTNILLDGNGKPQDFQSRMYGYSESWDEFKKYLLSNEPDTEKQVGGTMLGATKPSNSKVEEVLINDDWHVEIILSASHERFKAMYYLVTVEQFRSI